MQFQFNSDNQTKGDADVAGRLEALVSGRLDRILDRLTRIEVHVGDVNGPRGGGDDKSCTVEIRPNGMNPITATAQGPSIDSAASSAADKVLTAFDRQTGKATTRKGH